MLSKNTTNNENDQYYSIVIGDILLHSERKSISIQVISQSFVRKSSQIMETTNIPRVMLNSSELRKDQTGILCDLKNSITVPLKQERILSTRTFVRLHQAGWAFVKEIKSKVIAINSKPSKVCSLNTNTNNKKTHF